jgi:hypothetical protein
LASTYIGATVVDESLFQLMLAFEFNEFTSGAPSSLSIETLSSRRRAALDDGAQTPPAAT